MASAVIDGIETSYEVLGDGPPLLLCSPGGFNAVAENWRSFSIYARLRLLEHLPERFTCVVFDRRESGASGGRVERVSWDAYATQARGLLEHLGIERAHLLGGCVGCSVVLALGVQIPERVASMILYSPACGPRYRLAQHERFAQHLAFARDAGADAVVSLARETDKSFSEDPRVGLWASVLRRDDEFASKYAKQDIDRYRVLVAGIARTLFDRDTVPGAEPEDLLRLDIPALIVPGNDVSHAPSAARYLHECLAMSEYWDVPVPEQTESNAPARLFEFLGAHSLERN